MFKLYLLLFIGLFMLGCEVRVREDGPGSKFFGRSAGSDTSTVFSIKKRDTGTGLPAITESTDNTTVSSRVLSPLPATSNLFEIITPMGNMTMRLYDATPAHRDNFIKLARSGFYDGTKFHRVIANFIIQGGDPNSRDSDPNDDGIGGPGYTTKAEFTPLRFHKKGAIAAARQRDEVNPERRSSGSQFYIVHGRSYAPQELVEVEQYIGDQIRDNSFKFSPEAREAYTTIGGAPTLDMQYTVFGELVDGFDVLDRLSVVATDGRDRPREDIPMTIREMPAQ